MLSTFRATLIIAVSTLFVSTFAHLESSVPLFQCLAAYAKTKGITDPVFEAVDYDSSTDECVMYRQNFISGIRKEIRNKITEVEILPKYSNCIYEKLTGNEPFANSILKAAALEYSGLVEQSNKLKNTLETVVDYIDSSFVVCKTEIDFGEDFDKLFMSQKRAVRNVTDYEEEYCVKKYLTKNNLIDTVQYNIVLNIQHINTTSLNCEAMIKKFNEDIYERLGIAYLNNPKLKVEKVECALEKFREADYFDMIMKIAALTTINITSDQWLSERESYVSVLSNITYNISTC